MGSVHAYRLTGSTWTLLGKLSPVATDSLAGFSVAASSLGRGVVGNAQGAGEVPLTGSASFLANLEPVYRFYNAGAGTHFFTNTAGERDMVIATWPAIFNYEGSAYCTNPLNNTQPLFRFYKPSSSSHFYTADESERDSVIAALSHVYTYDGPTYSVTRYPDGGGLPVYRFYNVRNGSHFYTADAAERDHVAATLTSVYRYEGPAFWLGQ